MKGFTLYDRGAVAAALAAALLWAVPASAADYYVDQKHPSASDSNPGTESLPWKTLYRAETQMLQPGDTVYVKPGDYDASVGGSWSEPAINLAASGTAAAPITLKAIPRHGATVRGNGAAPALGSRGRHYIVIDGFVVTGTSPKGMAVFGTSSTALVKGVVLQNNIVSGIHIDHPTDNSDGIRIELADGALVRNNKIYDVRNGTMSWNAAGVKIYDSQNTVVENNEIYGASSGIFDKRGGRNNTHRRNYIHDCASVGVMIYTNTEYPKRDIYVYENVVDRTGKGALIHQNGDASILDNIQVYNNTFARYGSEGGMYPAEAAPAGRAYIYNNIFYRTSTPTVGDFFTYNDPPATVGLMNYNLFANNPKFTLGRYTTGRVFNGLAGWQGATGFDRNSLTGDPGFVDAASGDFRLANGSPALRAGRSGGISSGAVVNIGAYRTGGEVIGLLPDTGLPAAPRLLSVE